VLLEKEKSKMNEFLKLLKILLSLKFVTSGIRTIILIIIYSINISSILYSQNDEPDGQNNEMRFKQISLEQGLSQNVVTCIIQDRKGFMWFGTEDGLNRYDGYKFVVFKHSTENPKSISNNHILTIYEDHSGLLWIGTNGGGLNRFDREKEEFSHFKNEQGDLNSLSNNFVTSIYKDRSGTIWIGTNGGGLNRLNNEDVNILGLGEERFLHYKHIPGNPNSMSNNFIKTIFEDHTGVLWIGTRDGGLNEFNSDLESFTHYKNEINNPQSLSSNSVQIIYEDDSGVLWVGTEGGGLNKFDPVGKKFSHFVSVTNEPNSLSSNIVYSVFEDFSGTLWIGTEDGLNKFDRENKNFVSFRNIPGIRTSLSNDIVFSIYEDRSGALWVGTNGGGINKFEREKDNFILYKKDPNNPNSLSNNFVTALYVEENDIIWIGTEGGLNRYDRKEDKFTKYKHNKNNPGSLSNNVVSSIYKDNSGVLWIGTFRGGLNKYNEVSGDFTHYRKDEINNSISSDVVKSIYEDRSGKIWVGTDRGLNKFDRGKEKFINYINNPSDGKSLSSNVVNSIYEDRSGILWVGTDVGINRFNKETNDFSVYRNTRDRKGSLSNNVVLSMYEDRSGVFWVGTEGGGLNRFDRDKEKFISYQERDGLPNNIVYGILEDGTGTLWISTDKGLTKFDPTSIDKFGHPSFIFYDVNDGLQSNKFNQGACFKSTDGEMFFGGVGGFNSFFPDRIKVNQYIPPVVITDFKIFYKSVPIGGSVVEEVVEGVTEGVEGVEGVEKVLFRSPLIKSINETEEIKLPHKKNVFTFEFAALNYTTPEKNQYMYKLDGFDKNWVYAGTRRSVTYTNLDPGEYVFRVKGSNNDGVWNETGTSLIVTIKPPWYQTWWAYSLYAVLFVLIIYGYTRMQSKRIERERSVSERLRRVDKLKDEFLANTSHELRTPLNGIIGIAESLYDGVAGDLSEKTKSNLSMIISSGKRLTSLVNSILDFSKLKIKDLELQIKPVDINSITDIVLKINEPLIAGKELSLKNEIGKDIPPVEGDENRLLQIMYNLIGNAIKFTKSGTVAVYAKQIDNMVEVSVSDTGIGIQQDKIKDIFKSFEQVDSSTAREYGGTGLGLAITKQLVELHGGEVRVESEVGISSTFSYTIPVSKGKAEPQSKKQEVAKVTDIDDIEIAPTKKYISKENAEFKILIVDDDPINQQVLKNHLSFDNYHITSALNGEEALNEIESGKNFDLILLDIMMPRMSGYEVCKIIREKYLPSELPIILITAKNQVSDLVEGFSHGANDYLAKPFSKNEFLARIKTHLNLLKINSSYERFVPQEFLRSLGHESILDVKLGDQVQKEVTIFFSDIRSYTTLSEAMTPKDNFDFLNAYLKRVGPFIKTNNGFVNQYYGDGIMALFLGKTEEAVTASIEIQKEVAQYNVYRINKGRIPISIGIGLHTGSLMLGIIGDELRFDTGVVSDSVNTASRMEGLSKFYGSSIIISEMTLSFIKQPDKYHQRFLGKVQVKGKMDTILVYEVFDGDTREMMQLKIETESDFEEGLRLYFLKKFADATVFFKKVVDINPNDRAAKLYLKHCAHYMINGVPSEWTGVESMESK
jgi:signal transduction histidine kinase/ligand-binding sensor domain-containing protein/class 3 adenylate cyclase